MEPDIHELIGAEFREKNAVLIRNGVVICAGPQAKEQVIVRYFVTWVANQ